MRLPWEKEPIGNCEYAITSECPDPQCGCHPKIAPRLLLLGGAGFVGANLAVYFAERGYNVMAMDNLVRRGSEFNLSRLRDAGVAFRHGDVRCVEDWPQNDFDVVLDTAAQPSAIDGYDNPLYDLTNNTTSVFNTIEYCRTHRAGLIFWATNKVYPASAINGRVLTYEPTRIMLDKAIDESCPLDGGDRSIYGATKVAADLIIQEYADAFDIPAVVNRFSCLSGPYQWGKTEQGWLAFWVIAHRLHIPLTYFGYEGKQVRDALFMPDICTLIEKQIDGIIREGKGGVFNVGGGWDNAVSLVEATEICREMTGTGLPITHESIPRRADFACYISNIDKVCKAYNWEPRVCIREGFYQIDKWVCDNIATIEEVISL
jgi:CDP-paratose 2-epimerase